MFPPCHGGRTGIMVLLETSLLLSWGEKRDLICFFLFKFGLYFWSWLSHGDLEFSLLLLRTGFCSVMNWNASVIMLMPPFVLVYLNSIRLCPVIVCPLSGQQWGVYKRWSLIAFKVYIGNMCFLFLSFILPILSFWIVSVAGNQGTPSA